MILRSLIWAMFLSATTACAAAGWPKPDGDQGDALLRADQAFQMMPAQHEGHGVKLEWVIAPGYFMYRNRIHADIVEAGGTHPVALQLPAAQPYNEAGMGIVHIYRNDLSATFQVPAGTDLRRLRVRYQGCSDSGVCYPPQTRILSLKNNP